MRPHLATCPPAALASNAATPGVQGRHPCPLGIVCRHAPNYTYLTTAASSLTLAQEDCRRSADTRTLLVSRTLTNFGDRAFSATGPRVRNYLPTNIEPQPVDLSYSRFRQLLKTLISWTKAQCEYPLTAFLLIYLLTCGILHLVSYECFWLQTE